ncbi:MAG: PA0069 family radical SAM protein, partial [Spongiibacteraceae bacterium]|nr:PA0069 family radical SAM protein [Spongiibacteraceae bacterium]
MIKGRGTDLNIANRYAPRRSEAEPAEAADAETAIPQTEVHVERARTIISYNRSPDIPFDRSLNPYRGCEHGCIYCYARPTHAYLDWSPGLDFETKLIAKTNAADCLRKELARPAYQCAPITIGGNTDPYQPIEASYRLTRQLLEVLLEHRHPLHIITKSQAILDDLPLLRELARHQLVRCWISLTTLDDDLKRRLEPRTASGRARLRTIAALADAGVPVGVMTAPIIPVINDRELETMLTAAREAGAEWAGYVLVRLPLEVAPLFEAWLANHFPQRAAHVMSIIRQSRDGLNNQSKFGVRMRGTGVFADLLRQRFRRCSRQLGFNHRDKPLDSTQFRRPG